MLIRACVHLPVRVHTCETCAEHEHVSQFITLHAGGYDAKTFPQTLCTPADVTLTHNTPPCWCPHRLDVKHVVTRVKRILHGKSRMLVEGFNMFLPPEHHIKPAKMAVALDLVKKIRDRYESEGYIYIYIYIYICIYIIKCI